jgi:[ribosomal protein S18]-alanine N-acetyltransferase
MSEIIIREYKPADRNQCIAIFKSNVPKFFTVEELAYFETWLNGQDAGEVAYSNAKAEYYYVADEEGLILGCGGFYIAREESVARMAWGMVENSQHKQGIGKKLLAYRFNKIEELHPDCVISLDTSQHTYQFFEKFGFVVTKVQKDFYTLGMDRYDMERK